MKRIHRSAAVLAALALALPLPIAAAGTAFAAPPSAVAASAPAPSAVQLELPRPSGPYAIGRDTLHLTDASRRDPWVPSAGARELMVSMYYPARGGSGGATAPYMTVEEARLLLEKQKLGKAFPPELLSGTRGNARTAARPMGGKHPLVLLSPGFTLNRATLTLLAEDLSSRGYVVALMDHAYESFGTAFPGGRTLTCVACDTVQQAPTPEARKKLMGKVAEGRAADISFVIDQLTGRHGAQAASPARKYSRLIDARRIGAAGHSIGGNSAATAMAGDQRIRAGANLDGTFFTGTSASALGGRPFLMLGTEAGHSPDSQDTSWPAFWHSLDGWKRWLTVADAGHFTFNDLPVLGAQVGVSDPEAPLSGKRSGEITRDYVGAFFDQQLRGIPQPLLDGPSAANPEVIFNAP
ncbi:alpha/beta hydrolase family protein [Streptomyces sp. NPDC053427]|uniref:alpha/beta hydrolase family protein n=1 Tax=Streptomyces sp. NPDC053427 TaxID=3365701 RepID=UPI0037D770A4